MATAYDAEAFPIAQAEPRVFWTPLLFSIILAIYTLLPTGHVLRWLIYAVPATLFLETAVGKGTGLQTRSILVCLFYCVYAAIFASLLGGGSQALKDITFIGLSLFMIIPKYSIDQRSVIMIFSFSFLSILYSIVTSDGPIFAVSLSQSEGAAETSLGLALPLLAILFYERGKNLYLVLSVLLALLTFKRTAIAGLIVVVAADWVLNLVGAKVGTAARRFVDVILLAVVISVSLNFSELSKWAASAYSVYSGAEVSAAYFSAGRSAILDAFAAAVSSSYNWIEILFGGGAGRTTMFLDYYAQQIAVGFPLLHNDWYRIVAEYGWIGLLFVTWAFYRIMGISRLHWMLASYTAICFVSDNSLTYIFYWIVLIFCLRYRDNLARLPPPPPLASGTPGAVTLTQA